MAMIDRLESWDELTVSATDSDSGFFHHIEYDLPTLKNPNADSVLLLTKQLVDVHLPDLDEFEFGQRLEGDIKVAQPPILERNEVAVTTPPLDDQVEFWHGPPQPGGSTPGAKLLTWDGFCDPQYQARLPYCLSEAGPEALDAVLQAAERKASVVTKILRPDAYLQCLWQLVLGRASTLFTYNNRMGKFIPVLPDGRPSGLSAVCAQSFVDEVLAVGDRVRSLQQFSENTFAEDGMSRTDYALASAVHSVLYVVESYLMECKKDITSLLQLQAVTRPLADLLLTLKSIVDDTHTIRSGPHLLDYIFRQLRLTDSGGQMLQPLLLEIFRHVSRPWLSDLLTYTGLLLPSSVDAIDSHCGLPDFIDVEDIAMIDECHNCYQYLTEHIPFHPLVARRSSCLDLAETTWCFSLEDVERVTEKAKNYDQNIREFAKSFKTHSVEPGRPAPREEDERQQQTFNVFCQDPLLDSTLDSLPTRSLTRGAMDVENAVRGYFHDDERQKISRNRISLDSVPHLTLHPLLSVQNAHLNQAVLHHMLSTESLLEHFEEIHIFHLCSSGIFTSRLSDALFSTDVKSAERHRTRSRESGRRAGLRLGSGQRRTWPPADSELQLVLMNLLQDVREEIRSRRDPNLSMILPNNLSFSLRTTLSDEEMERILNADSIFALDFLSLAYVPPPGLRDIFTDLVLQKYDQIFRFQLRLLRVEFSMKQLYRYNCVTARKSEAVRTSRSKVLIKIKFQQEATDFFATLISYMRLRAVDANWAVLQRYLHSLSHQVKEGPGFHQSSSTAFSIHELTSMHMQTVNNILACCLLGPQQQAAAQSLELIFSDILQFAGLAIESELPSTVTLRHDNTEADLRKLNSRFHRNVHGFLVHCRALSCEDMSATGEVLLAQQLVDRSVRLAIQELVDRFKISGWSRLRN